MFNQINRFKPVILLLVLAMVLSACASTSQLKIVNRSKIIYDDVTDTIIELEKAGIIKKADVDKIEKYADIYADLHNAAVESVRAYKNGMATKDDVSAKIVAISAALTKLLQAAGPYIVEEE